MVEAPEIPTPTAERNTTRMTLRLPAELHSRLSDLALVQRVSLNEIIVRAGERYAEGKWKPKIREMLEDIRDEGDQS